MQHRSTPAPALDPATLGLHLFEASPDCVKLLDADGRIVAMNHNGQRAMQVTDVSRLVGNLWSAL